MIILWNSKVFLDRHLKNEFYYFTEWTMKINAIFCIYYFKYLMVFIQTTHHFVFPPSHWDSYIQSRWNWTWYVTILLNCLTVGSCWLPTMSATSVWCSVTSVNVKYNSLLLIRVIFLKKRLYYPNQGFVIVISGKWRFSLRCCSINFMIKNESSWRD